MGLKNAERTIAYYRYLKTLTFDWTVEMHRFKDQAKAEIQARVMNDGMAAKQRFESGFGAISGIESGLFARNIKMNSGNVRAVMNMLDGKRQTETIKWKELAPRTLRERNSQAKPYPTYPRLFRTGEMLNNCLYKNIYENVWKSGFKFGSTDKSAVVLHYGGKVGYSVIPERPFYYASNNLIFSFIKTIHLRVLSAFRYTRGRMM